MTVRSAATTALASAILLAGCTSGPRTHEVADTPTETAAPALLTELRNIDPCALYGDAEDVDGRALTVVGPTNFGGCASLIADAAGQANGDISVAYRDPVTPVADEDWVTRRVVDGVEVTQSSFWDAPNAPQDRSTVQVWSCNQTASYPDGTLLMVFASGPVAADACAIGQRLVATAISQFALRPSYADAKFPTTVLTGADPCAPVRDLDGVADPQPSVRTCYFSLNGRGLSVEFQYTLADRIELEPQRDFHGHLLVGDTANSLISVVVGEAFRIAGAAMLPLVTIFDEAADDEAMLAVAQAVAQAYPA